MLFAAKGLDPESPGIILYDVNTTKQTILFTLTAVDGTAPKLGDKVQSGFLIARLIITKLSVLADSKQIKVHF